MSIIMRENYMISGKANSIRKDKEKMCQEMRSGKYDGLGRFPDNSSVSRLS